MRITIKALYFVVLFSLMSTVAFGQADSGSISGTVRDTTGAVVPDAKVSARNNATSAERTAATDSAGGYTIPGLPSGFYDITISKGGFADYKTRAQVTVGSFVNVSAQLLLTTVTSSIEVVATGGTEINTSAPLAVTR